MGSVRSESLTLRENEHGDRPGRIMVDSGRKEKRGERTCPAVPDEEEETGSGQRALAGRGYSVSQEELVGLAGGLLGLAEGASQSRRRGYSVSRNLYSRAEITLATSLERPSI